MCAGVFRSSLRASKAFLIFTVVLRMSLSLVSSALPPGEWKAYFYCETMRLLTLHSIINLTKYITTLLTLPASNKLSFENIINLFVELHYYFWWNSNPGTSYRKNWQSFCDETRTCILIFMWDYIMKGKSHKNKRHEERTYSICIQIVSWFLYLKAQHNNNKSNG